jgi:hypothetical protein
MISKLAMLAKKTIEAAWLNGPAYDLATQAAEALESAQLLQSPETAADYERLRASMREIRHLHTDSPMGPCPVCIDADALGRDEDPTMPWPCATAVLAGAKEVEPESVSVPGFFRPGLTYTRNLSFRAPEDRPNFECIGIGMHPSKGVLRAFGFEQPGSDSPWVSASQRMEEWEEGWVEIGPVRPDRLTRTFSPTQALRAEANAEVSEDNLPGPSVFRAEEDGITLDHYTDREQARAHCLHRAKKDRTITSPPGRPIKSWRWVLDGPDPDEDEDTEELYAVLDDEEIPTGYTVTPITLADRFDPEADDWEDE